MGWVDLDTGEEVTPEEMASIKQDSRQAISARPTRQQQPTVHDFPSAAGHLGDQFAQGAMASLKKTYLGLKQLATYVGGDDAAREAVNGEIARMEEEYGAALQTPAGKIGNIAGTVAQFAIPGAIAQLGERLS